MSDQDRSNQDPVAESEAAWRPSRRGLLKAGAVAAAVTAIGAADEIGSTGVRAAGDTLSQRWTEATDGGVHSSAVGAVRTAKANFTFYALGSSWDGSNGAWPIVEYSFSSDGKTWGAPIQSPAAVEDGGRPNRDGRIFTQLVFLGGANFVRYRFLDGAGNPTAVTGFQLFFIDSTGGPQFGGASVSAASLPPLQQPPIVSRAGWGCRDPQGYADSFGLVWPPEYQTVEHVILHHSETLNETPGGDAVRSIYIYHTDDRGWGDIGYNYLVDNQGVIYEGRVGGANVVGGHAFQYAFGSSGICAVGSFMTQDITSACKSSIIKITAWAGRALKPLGRADFHQVRSLPTICGHRDTNQTECPGDVYYGDMNDIRTQVSNLLNATSHTPPGTPGPGGKFKTGDNVIFRSSTRLHVEPDVNSRTVITAATNQYGAIDGALRYYKGQDWQAVRVSTTTEGYCRPSQLDFAPAGNPPAAIYEIGDTVVARMDMILRRSPGEAQNAPYTLAAGESLYVSAAEVAATGSRWVGVMSQDHATGYVKQEDVALAAARRVTLNPAGGVVGTTITISVSGFPATRSTSIVMGGVTVKNVTTSSTGSFTTTFIAPEATTGSRAVRASVGVASQYANFAMAPSVAVSPVSGRTNSQATVTVHGFLSNQSVAIQWNNGSAWTTLATVTTTSTGTASTPIKIPAAPNGSLTLRALAGSSVPTVVYTVTGQGTNVTSIETKTPTPAPTKTKTPAARATGTSTPVRASTATPTAPAANTATEAPTNTPIATATDIPTETPTDTPTDTPAPADTPTETPTDTPAPTETPVDTPTETPTPG